MKKGRKAGKGSGTGGSSANAGPSGKGGKAAGSAARKASPGKGGRINGNATLELHFPSSSSARAAFDSLEAEADFAHRGGSKVILNGITVRVEICADDPVSLRASLNSYLRLMHIIKTLDENIPE